MSKRAISPGEAGIGDFEPTADVVRNGVEEISGDLRRLLADVFALYLKTKNFHWHMSGRHFRDYHLLLDEQAEQLFAMTDDIAERAQAWGKHPAFHQRDLKTSTIEGRQPRIRPSRRHAGWTLYGQSGAHTFLAHVTQDLRRTQRCRHGQLNRRLDRRD